MRLGRLLGLLSYLQDVLCLWPKLGMCVLHLLAAAAAAVTAAAGRNSAMPACGCTSETYLPCAQQWFCSHHRATPPLLGLLALPYRPNCFPSPVHLCLSLLLTARQYLEDLRAAAGGGAGDEDGDDGDGGDFRTGAAVDEEVDEKLRLDALEVSVARDTCRPTLDTCRSAATAGTEASLCQQHNPQHP